MTKIERKITVEDLEKVYESISLKFTADRFIIKNEKNIHITSKELAEFGARNEKRLKRYVNAFNRKQTLRAANKILWEVSKTSGHDGANISEPKHEKIQKKKKLWKKANEHAEQLLKEYKEEKGSYYKN